MSADGHGPLNGRQADFISPSTGRGATAPDVTVWTVDLDQRSPIIEALSETLTDDEMERACRLRNEQDRARYIAARAALRQVIGRELQQSPSSLRFAVRDQGKPYLLDCETLDFNVSHSYGLCLIALTDGVPVGVDVERIAPVEGLETLAREIMAPAEFAALRTASDPMGLFYSCWTRKEAYVKARGEAWAITVPDIELALGARPRFLRLPGDDPAPWSLIDLQPAPGYIGALAVRRPGASLRLGEWNLNPDAAVAIPVEKILPWN